MTTSPRSAAAPVRRDALQAQTCKAHAAKPRAHEVERLDALRSRSSPRSGKREGTRPRPRNHLAARSAPGSRGAFRAGEGGGRHAGPEPV